MHNALAIWMNGELVGHWSVGRTGLHRLEYAPEWRLSSRSRPLSLSLPFTADSRLEGEAVCNYFDNLLPDSEHIRRRMGARFRTRDMAQRLEGVLDTVQRQLPAGFSASLAEAVLTGARKHRRSFLEGLPQS